MEVPSREPDPLELFLEPVDLHDGLVELVLVVLPLLPQHLHDLTTNYFFLEHYIFDIFEEKKELKCVFSGS